jgi:serine/threonine-protein kinase
MQSIGDWRLGPLLGRGGMGEVYEATHRRFGHRVALKRVLDADPSFAAEVRAIARLDHPTVVRIFDQGDDPHPWFAMERARGTLASPPDWTALRSALADVLEALAVAHAAGVLHLDVKPSNILVGIGERCVLADFGVARFTDEGQPLLLSGSLAYMAPERFDGRPLGPETDLYAVGILAWELATGAPPWVPGSWAEASEVHAVGSLPPFRPVVSVPSGFEAWVRALLATHPDDRPVVAADALHALRSLDASSVVVVAAPRGAQAAPSGATTRTVPLGPGGALRRGPTDRDRVAPIPERWPAPEPRRRLEGVGLGLLGLLDVPLKGRETQQARLWQELRSEQPSLVVLRGPPGSGKSRLGEAFCQAAAAWAGATVLHGADEAAGPRTVRWLDEVDEVPEALDARVTVISSRSPEPLPGTVDVPLAPLPDPVVRSLLASWIGLGPELVAEVASRCEGDVGLALQMVRDGLAQGLVVPGGDGLRATAELPMPLRPVRVVHDDLVAAAIGGRRIDDPRLRDVAERLVAAGDAVRDEEGTRWASPSCRHHVLASASPEALRRAHRFTALAHPDESWERGVHLLHAGDVAEAVEALYLDCVMPIASGRMAEAAAVFAQADRRIDPDDRLSRARLDRALAILGPTHQGHRRTFELNERAIVAARPHADDDPDWADVLASALGGQLWLCNVLLQPALGMVYLQEREGMGIRSNAVRTGRAGLLMLAGGAQEAHDLYTEAMHDGVARGNQHTATVCAAQRAVCRDLLGRDDAVDALLDARDGFHRVGLASAYADVEGALGNALRARGRFDEAARHYERALQLASEGEARSDLTFKMGRALLWRDMGRLDDARLQLEACQRLLTDEGEAWEAVVALHLASVRALLGDDDARADAHAAATIATRHGLDHRDLTRSLELAAAGRGLDGTPSAS